MISPYQKNILLRNPWMISYYDLDERDQYWIVECGMFRYLNNPAEATCKKAIIKNPRDIMFIKNPSKEVQKECLSRDQYCMNHIKNWDESVVAEIMTITPNIIGAVKNPSRTLILLYFHLSNGKPNQKVLMDILSNNDRNYDVADIIVKELYKNDEDLLSEWKFQSRKAKLEKMLK